LVRYSSSAEVPAMPRTPAPGTRDRILDNACRLFSEHGVRNVGLQQVIDETGCGKNLLYREFASKDELVLAWLARSQDTSRATTDEALAAHAGDPAAQLVALVRATADEVACPGYRGCCLRNTHAEFPDPDHPAHRLSAEYAAEIQGRLLDLATQAGARDPDALAKRVMLIVDGMITNASIFGGDGAAAEGVALAEEVVAAAVR
jgi:AcrR family transcriptional regulator